MLQFFKEKKQKEISQSSDSIEIVPISTPKNPKDTWIEVTGFKGLNENMQGYGNFTFQIGETYEIDEEPALCRVGFHFCRNLRDVLSYYDISKRSRYFKVSAVVKQSDWDNYGKMVTNLYTNQPYRLTKIAAKKITLTHELTIHEIYDGFQIPFSKHLLMTFYDSQNNISEVLTQNLLTNLKDCYSQLFVLTMAEKIMQEWKPNNKKSWEDNVAILEKIFSELEHKALGLYEENVSPDMRAYLLLK